MLRILLMVGLAQLCLIAGARAETYRLNYEVAVLGVVVLGTASYEVTSNATRYAVRANLRTSGLARLFDQTEVNATTIGSVSGATIAFTRYDLSHAYAGKFRRTQLNRSSAGVVTPQVTPNYGDLGTPPATQAQQSASSDPLSGLFGLGRQVAAARACNGSVLVFDGRQHYRLVVAGGRQAEFNAGGYRGPAITCQFRYEPISGFSMTAQERARIPVGEATFALAPNMTFAAPLRIAVPTPLGSGVIEVRSYQRTE